MNAFEAGYQTGLYKGFGENPYTVSELRAAWERGYEEGVFEHSCLETQDQSREEHEEN